MAESAARGAVASVITQGVAVATGLQDSFSWAGVAAAAVSAGVGRAAWKHFGPTDLTGPNTDLSIGNIAEHLAIGATRSIAYAAVRSQIEGTSFRDAALAGLPDLIGQTIGEAIAGRLSRPSEAYVEAEGDSPLPGGRQLHEREIELIQQNAPEFARRNRMSFEDAERLLAQRAYRQVNPAAPEVEFSEAQQRRARDFLNGLGRAQRDLLLPGDQRQHHRRALAATVGAGEKPGLAPQRDAAQW